MEGNLNHRVTVIAASILLICGLSAAFAGAKLDISSTTFDFGIIPQVGKVSHTYYMKSTGTDSLRILGIKPGCGCTKAPLEKEVVAPGDSTGVELIFTSSEAYRGKTQKTATVTCNDDDRGSFLLRFTAQFNTVPDSAKPIQLAPWSLEIAEAERARELAIAVRNVSDQPLTLKLAGLPLGFLKVTLPVTPIAPNESATIKVQVDPKCKANAFEKSFTIECSDVQTTNFTVPVVFGKPTSASSSN